nr:MAG TPA: holin [Caudoviricetes sp.]
MKEIWNTARSLVTILGGTIGWFFGEMDGFFYALLAFVVLDYVTGLMCGILSKTLSSEVGFKGICKKLAIFVMVGIAHILDAEVIGTGSVLRTAILFFYLSNEGISILENCGRLGLPIPQKLKDVLAQLKTKSEDEE